MNQHSILGTIGCSKVNLIHTHFFQQLSLLYKQHHLWSSLTSSVNSPKQSFQKLIFVYISSHPPLWSEDPLSRDWKCPSLSQEWFRGTCLWSGYSQCSWCSPTPPSSAWWRCRRRSCPLPTEPRQVVHWLTFQASLRTWTGKLWQRLQFKEPQSKQQPE